MLSEAPSPPPAEAGTRSAVVEIARYACHIADRLLDDLQPLSSGFAHPRSRGDAIAAYQLLWGHHVATGAPRWGEAVLHALRTICRSTFVDHVGGGLHRACADDERRGPRRAKTLSDNALFLELLTWVWRVARCSELRRCAEGIAGWAVAEMRVPGLGFAASAGPDRRGERIRADANGLMLVALIEAGSVFERRDLLASARDVFDEVVANIAEAGVLWHRVDEGARGAAGRLKDYAMMSRAAIRFFEAFGKRRYLDQAEAWVATLEAGFRDDGDGAYRRHSSSDAAWVSSARTDDAPPSGNAAMIGVLARLHALTRTPRYAVRAKTVVAAFHGELMRSGRIGASALANIQTAAQLVTIEISGDPRLAETRALMRIALDCGLPDRLVLGPGAGGTPGERPLARMRVGAKRLAPIGDAAQLRQMLAPGGLAAEFTRFSTSETVDSRCRRDVT